MIKIKKLSKSYGNKKILNDISFQINKGNRIGLIGANGIGKSTLMRIIAGAEEQDSGEIVKENNILIGYLKQEFNFEDEEKTIEEFLKSYVGIDELEEQMLQLENDLENTEKLEKYGQLQEKFTLLDGYNIDYKIDNMLGKLGFEKNIKNKKIKQLSGGQKNKILLLGVLLKGIDLLLLDEPTNNLDLKSIIWLQKYLNSISTPMIIISHDRKLLDSVTNKTIEIDEFTKKINEYPGTFTEYEQFKQAELQRKLQEYEEQEVTINNLKKSMGQKKEWAQKGRKQGVKDKDKYTRGYERDRSSSLASNAKKIEKQIEQIDKVEKPKIKKKLSIDIKTPADKEKGSTDIICQNLVCGYPNGFKTAPISFSCKFGEKIVIVGDNGSGKSTFINTLLGKIPAIEGINKIGTALKIGYISQNTKINKDISVGDFIESSTKTVQDKGKIFTVLDKFNFSYDDRNRKYSELSPGERTRLILASFCLKDINTLILDEPTNHLDIEAINAIEEVVDTFKGTVIAITHDRTFIEKIFPNRVLLLSKSGLSNIISNEKEISGNEYEEIL